jgi:hypothetical protein
MFSQSTAMSLKMIYLGLDDLLLVYGLCWEDSMPKVR